MMLVAIRPVLYRSTQYRAGDRLPADNQDMVSAWLEYGSAEWKNDDEEPTKAPKAEPIAPPEGKPGISSDGDPDARVGRVPKKGRARK